MVYTRAYDGIGPKNTSNAVNTYTDPITQKKFMKTSNIPYWFDPNATFDDQDRVLVNPLHIDPTYFEDLNNGGKRVIPIDPNLYPAGYGECVHANVQNGEQRNDERLDFTRCYDAHSHHDRWYDGRDDDERRR